MAVGIGDRDEGQTKAHAAWGEGEAQHKYQGHNQKQRHGRGRMRKPLSKQETHGIGVALEELDEFRRLLGRRQLVAAVRSKAGSGLSGRQAQRGGRHGRVDARGDEVRVRGEVGQGQLVLRGLVLGRLALGSGLVRASRRRCSRRGSNRHDSSLCCGLDGLRNSQMGSGGSRLSGHRRNNSYIDGQR